MFRPEVEEEKIISPNPGSSGGQINFFSSPFSHTRGEVNAKKESFDPSRKSEETSIYARCCFFPDEKCNVIDRLC